ncbi:MAG: hypothetical protein A3H64_01400 [Candidatus Ryanbacteria bacterium RIFCSPLOWO2_02_FULL_45_11c]|uniref:DUF5667 domain-containing protein n=1 Tax=Candidatus Ryanbacteria bacterium RIFCSPLOWO2_02_FULL_45_11c TaxID=1802128 RepID=A0A1G2H0P5_9BACT|nr:MAG: hypothetical protein A3H64_01400 [Candidatus Ryanbacteria bacterium RIFCSPLOWO2_02_FULL_45_11c]
MKNFLFINMLSVMVFFAGGSAVFAQDVSPPDADLRARMQERMRVQQENRETQMMEQREGMEERRADMLRRQAEALERMETRHEELRQRWEERKAQLSERRKQNIKNHVERIIQRTEQVIDRLGNMANKIEDRMTRLQEEGAEVTALRLLLEEARSGISRADVALDTAAAELRVAPDADNPVDALGNARILLEGVKTALREAHAALVEIVVEIKKGQLIPNDNEDDSE